MLPPFHEDSDTEILVWEKTYYCYTVFSRILKVSDRSINLTARVMKPKAMVPTYTIQLIFALSLYPKNNFFLLQSGSRAANDGNEVGAKLPMTSPIYEEDVSFLVTLPPPPPSPFF